MLEPLAVTLFWGAAAFVLYVYAGYPALLCLWARVRPREIRTDGAADPVGVTIILAARDEAHRLRMRLDNLLELDHPAALRQIVVVSDGSTDGTEAVVAGYGSLVDFVAIPAGGKAVALNAAVERARFDVLIFADARQLFAPDAIAELTRPLSDPHIGAVSGELVLDCESGWRRSRTEDRRASARHRADRRQQRPSAIAAGVGAYWRYEKALRRLESTVGSMLGATGAIYALRRSLWRPLPAGTILDDVLGPMRVVLDGRRIVFNPRARAFDWAAPDASVEAARKTRTLTGNYQMLWLEPRLLLPWRNPVWLQFVSHKIARLLVPAALVLLLASNFVLAPRPFYLATLLAQCGFYLLAAYGAWLERRERLVAAPAPQVPAGAKEAVNA